MTEREPVRGYVYWDYSCPFSYVASHRLRRLAGERPLELHWRPFEVHPGLPEEGIPARELGYAPDQWSRLLDSVSGMAEEEGLELSVPDFVPRTSAALEAALFAADVGADAFDRLHPALFRAFFVEGRNIGRRETVIDVAESAGVDPEGLERALEDERYTDELRRVHAETDRYDIDGTPTVLFGRHKVVGAAPMRVLREAADRAASEADGDVPEERPEERPGEGSPGSSGGS